MAEDDCLQAAQDDSVAVYLHAIRVESARKAARIHALEVERAVAGAENRELRAAVERLKSEARGFEARALALKAELRGVRAELQATKSEAEAQATELSGVSEELQAAKRELAWQTVRSEGEDGRDEWITSQGPKRLLEHELSSPSPRKRQKAGQEHSISPTHKGQQASEAAAVSLILALEKDQPWNAVYAKSPTFSHTFEYELLAHEAKICILALQIFKSKFRRELWEQLHWIGFRSDGDLVAAATKFRAARHQTAKLKWKELQGRLSTTIASGLLPEEIWSEPFMWVFRAEPLNTPSACITMSCISDLDMKEPMRCFYVDCIDQHPFYKSGSQHPTYPLPDSSDLSAKN